MPRLIDHTQRRAEIVAAAWRVIRRVGIDGTTTRAIAAEAGCSLSVLAHFFGAKEDLLVAAQTQMYDRIIERAFRTAGELNGLEALACALDAALPLDEERAFDAAVNVAFAAAALSDPALAAARRRSHARIRTLLAHPIAEARAVDEIRPGLDDVEIGDEFIVLVEGGVLLGLVDADPGDELTARLTRVAAAFIERLRATPTG